MEECGLPAFLHRAEADIPPGADGIAYFAEDIPSGAACYTTDGGRFLYLFSQAANALLPWYGGAFQSGGMTYLPPEELVPLSKITVAWDAGLDRFASAVRRPGYSLRGRAVTPCQAVEILRRTERHDDRELQDEISRAASARYLSAMNFPAAWLAGSDVRGGWCRPDGTIGGDGFTGKYPNAQEFVREWGALLAAFPDLDVMIAVWGGNETIGRGESDPIQCGLHAADGRIELLSPERAREQYQTYAARYPLQSGCGKRPSR